MLFNVLITSSRLGKGFVSLIIIVSSSIVASKYVFPPIAPFIDSNIPFKKSINTVLFVETSLNSSNFLRINFILTYMFIILPYTFRLLFTLISFNDLLKNSSPLSSVNLNFLLGPCDLLYTWTL